MSAHPSTVGSRRSSTRRVVAVAGALSLLASGCGLFGDDEDATLPAPAETDVAYGDVAGCDGSDADCGGSQTLDIYRSDEPGPNPVLVFFHGGGFVGGDKADSVSTELEAVLDAGWDIVSVNYRLTTPQGENAFPAAVRDAKQAVRWIKANADEQDWDADNVAAMGHSAGGNLAGMLGVTANEPLIQPLGLSPELAEVDESVIGVLGLNSVFDITLFGENPDWSEAMRHYTGCSDNCSAAYAVGSVQTHVDAESAPMIAWHGAQDLLAAPAHGEQVRDAYERAGIGDRFELIVVDDGPERYQVHTFDYERYIDRILEFLETHRS